MQIVPVSTHSATFEAFFRDRLNIIVQTCAPPKPRYTHGPLKRAWGLCNMFTCMVPMCTPCLVWDTGCLAGEFCCKRSCCWGLSCLCLSKMWQEIHKDVAATAMETFRAHKQDIDPAALHAVCQSYMTAFDALVADKTTRSARGANVIRAELVNILYTYGPLRHEIITLRDDGDITNLRTVIDKIRPA